MVASGIIIIGEQSNLSLGRCTEDFVLPCMAVCGMLVYIFLPYTHIPENTQKILRIRRDKVVV